MAWSIKKEGNYIYATNTVSGLVHDFHSADMRISKKTNSSDLFSFFVNGIEVPGMCNIPIAEIVAENGTDFTDLSSFENWKNLNTGE